MVVIYAADAGSLASGNFAWYRHGGPGATGSEGGRDPESLAASVAADLAGGQRVALGFETPLWWPVPPDTERLGRKRPGEPKPFSAGAGAAITPTGVVQLAWVLREAAELAGVGVRGTLDGDAFYAGTGDANLLVWEACVTGRAKGRDAPHAEDARDAATAFAARVGDGPLGSDVPSDGLQSLSLAGAALLFAGLSHDVSLLTTAPLVVTVPGEAS